MEKSCKVCRKWQDHFYWSHRDPTNVRFLVKMEASFRRYLNLPRKFAKNFRGKISGFVKLKGHGGKFWQVQVIRSGNSISLRLGWRDFVTANKIDENDRLVFKYNNNSSFDVLIFDPTGCEKAAPAPRIVKNEQTESESETETNSESETETKSESESETETETEKISSYSDASVRVITPPEKTSSDSVLSSPATNAEKKRGRNDEGTSRNAKKTKETHFDKPYQVANKTELSVTQQEIADTMACATEQGSKLFVKVLCSTDLKYHLLIPKCFSNLHLEKRSQSISLQMANEEEKFPAYYCYGKDRQLIGSSWIKFAISNNLKETDLCLFELKRLGAQLAFVVHVRPRAI